MKCAFASFAIGWSAVAQAGINDKLPLDAYRDPIDRQIAETGKGIPGRPFPCVYEEMRNGHQVMEIQPTILCVKMLPQQRWRGLWRMGQESSEFCPEPAKKCPEPKAAESVWLSNGPGRDGMGELYQVEFIGRKTMYKGPYGNGFYDQEITIDRAIKIELIEPAKAYGPLPK